LDRRQGQRKERSKTMNTRHGVISTEELGELTLVASGGALVGVYFPDHTTKPDRTSFGESVDCATDPVLSEAAG
jgi:methylated-DNA-[protein]-cysteine S-methyltransferase